MEITIEEDLLEPVKRIRTAEKSMPKPKFKIGDKVKFLPKYQDFFPVEQRYCSSTLKCRGLVGLVFSEGYVPDVDFDGIECAIDQEDLSLMGRKR